MCTIFGIEGVIPIVGREEGIEEGELIMVGKLVGLLVAPTIVGEELEGLIDGRPDG